ncbi:ABC transporter ATP-binding protein [Neptunicella marina]|uniref:ABC transporter ATP-binding protein n=1 Tax=Neptunicella marina TaxID=2125989 RepID=A0A8J6J166_9ALTE|nr:ABC transporter ATP-binding protein [Neptunicella marina]MBC3767801.1 ABC transporter ATP-binding protein [Neptunicella marina]
MSDYAIDVSGLVKRFDNKVAVNGVDIKMPKGQVWGFLGPNGSGKTTTIRMICGLLQPSEGKGQCLGFDILKQSAQIKNLTGYMTQKFSFWGDLTIRENLEFVARLYQLKNIKQIVDNTLANLGLTHRQHQLAGALSGGWKQRLALAAVTMSNPKLLLLDEPTAGVDPQARRDFWDEIHKLSAQGLTVLVSTHYMDEAERCDQIVYLANGELITQGSVDEIIKQADIVAFQLKGHGIREQLQSIKQEEGVSSAAYFGAAVHVCGKNADELKDCLHKYQSDDISLTQVDVNLEDAFIQMMANAGFDQRQHG